MRRTFERGTRLKLSFSGGPHAPVNMADSMENAGSWTVSGSKEVTEVLKNFKDLRKLGIRNMVHFFTHIHFFHTTHHVYRSVWLAREAKHCFGAALVRSEDDYETRL